MKAGVLALGALGAVLTMAANACPPQQFSSGCHGRARPQIFTVCPTPPQVFSLPPQQFQIQIPPPVVRVEQAPPVILQAPPPQVFVQQQQAAPQFFAQAAPQFFLQNAPFSFCSCDDRSFSRRPPRRGRDRSITRERFTERSSLRDRGGFRD